MPSGRLAASGDTDDPRRLVRAVVVRHLGDGGDLVEVVRRRRRGRQPLESLAAPRVRLRARSEEHTSELQSHLNLVCRLLLEKKKKNQRPIIVKKKKKNKKKK